MANATVASVTLHDLLIPQFMLELKALKGILKKGQEWATARKVEPEVFFGTRLVPDQFALSRQIQICCDSAKLGVAKLTGQEFPAFEDNEKTFEEFNSRIDKTMQLLEGVKAEAFNGYEGRKATFKFRPDVYLEGQNFLVQHVVPNFYFHMTTAYAILRASGVDVGKQDFLGEQNWKKL